MLTLHYDNGKKKYELQQSLPPGEQMWVNLTDLIRNRVPDRNGNVLPVDVSAVTYDLQDLTPGGHSLTESTLAVNNALGNQFMPDCPSCCGYPSAFFSPDDVDTFVNGVADLSVYGINSCSGSEINLGADFPTWGSDNSAIATVTKGQVQGVAPGATTGYAEGYLPIPGKTACGCDLYGFQQITEPITVASCPASATTSLTDPLNLSLVYPNLLTGIGNAARVTITPGGTVWNGQNVTEVVSAVTAANTCPTGFPNACTGSTTFQIGSGYQPNLAEGTSSVSVGPILVATTNQFFDQYSATSNQSLLDYYDGGNQCAQTCSQQYSNACAQNVLDHTFTYTFTKSTISGTKVTLVTVSE